MARSTAPRLMIMLGVAIIVVINAVLFRSRLTSWIADGTGRLLAPVSGRAAHLRALIITAVGRRNLAAENLTLQDELLRARAQLAGEEALQRQMEFYRDAAGIRGHTGEEPIAAGIFSYPQSGGVVQAVINRGKDDGVRTGDAVVTPSGAFVGAVSVVFDRHCVVSMIGDVALDVTVRISGTDISGLLRPDSDGSIIIDLIQKNETVTEHTLVVTSGDDHYPSGLVVGTVRSVDNDAETLFKTVYVTPAVPRGISGEVLIVRP